MLKREAILSTTNTFFFCGCDLAVSAKVDRDGDRAFGVQFRKKVFENGFYDFELAVFDVCVSVTNIAHRPNDKEDQADCEEDERKRAENGAEKKRAEAKHRRADHHPLRQTAHFFSAVIFGLHLSATSDDGGSRRIPSFASICVLRIVERHVKIQT